MNEKSTLSLLCRAALACTLAIAAGCIPSQQHDIAMTREFIDGNKPASVKIAPDRVLTLTDALLLANQNLEQLSLQGETYLQALLTKDQTFASFLPTIGFSPSWSFSNSPHVYSRDLSAPVVGNLNLFNGFRDYNTLLSNNQSIEQQKQLVFDAQQTVLLDVAQTYYTVLTNEQSVQVLTNSLQVQRVNVHYMAEQQHVGAANPVDVAEAEAEASATRVQLLQAQASVGTARAMLAYLVAEPIEHNPLRDDFEPPLGLAPLQAWIAQAEAGRQDLLAAAAAVRAARYNVEVAFGQYYPTVSLNLNSFLYSQGIQPASLWNGAISLNLPIFTGGLIRAEVRQAWSLFRQAALTQQQLRRNIDQAVETAYINLDLARQSMAELQVELKAARDEFNVAQVQYKVGGGTYLAVLQAQITLISAQLQFTSELFTQKTAYFNLLRAAGQLSFADMRSTTRPSEAALVHLATQPVALPPSPATLPLGLPATTGAALPSTLPSVAH